MKHTFSTARLLSFVMVLAVLLTAGIVLGINASAEDTTATEVGTEAELIEALTAGGDIQLTADIKLTATATINVSANATLSSKQDESTEGTEIYTITRSQTTGFSMFTVASGVTFTLENVTLEGGNFEDTNSKTYGGAIRNSGTFVILGEGATIQNFRAARGGAVYGKVALLSGSVIRGNYASYGGSAIATNTVWIMPGALIENNESGASAYGGVIFLDSGGKMVMRGGTIQNNTSKRLSSVVDTNGNFTIYLAGGTIINNSVDTVAPAILMRPSATKNSGKIYIGTNNTSGQPAGVTGISPEESLQLYNNGESSFGYHTNRAADCLTVDRLVFDANFSTDVSRVDYTIATFDVPETSEGAGDGYTAKHYSLTSAIADALVKGVSEITLERFDEGVATLPEGTYTINGAGNTFKRVVSGVSMFTVPEGANATFTNITLDGNSIAANGENGGAFNVAEGATLTLAGKDTEKVTVSGFEAALGGAIYTKGTLNVTDAVITENNATSTASNSGGGGIFVAGGTVTVDGATEITGNTAVTAGGGIGALATAGNKAYITVKGNAKVDGNTATNGGGACISSHSSLTLSGNAVLSNNFVSGTYGGGIYLPSGTVVLEENASITGNYLALEGWAVGEGVSMQSGTFVMTGGSITNNGKGGADAYDNWHHGGALYATGEAKIWILGGTVSGNEASNRGAAFSVNHADAKLYMLGGTVTGNLVGGTTANNVGNGTAIYTVGTVYLLGGSITENGIQTTEQGAYVADIVTSETGALHLGSSVTPDSIPDAVAAYAETEAGKAIFEIVDGVVTSKNPLTVADGGVGANTPKNISGTIYIGDLVKGSKVVFEDNAADLGYFATLDTGYTTLSDATLAAIQLNGADALFEADVVGDGTLVWPKDAYQVWQNVGLRDDIAFRLYFARRDASVSAEELLAGLDVTVDTRVYSTSDGGYVDKQLKPAFVIGTVAGEMAERNAEFAAYVGVAYVEIPMAPKQIMDAITFTLDGEHVGFDNEGHPKTYSIAAYLTTLNNSVAKALLDYGSAAQAYFQYNAETLANGGSYADGLTVGAIDWILPDKDAGFHSALVDVGSKVSVAIILKAEAMVDKVTFGGVELTEGVDYTVEEDESGTYVALTFNDIFAKDLTKEITVTVGTSTLTYSIPIYAYRTQSNLNASAELVLVAQTLNRYAEAALAYANAQ